MKKDSYMQFQMRLGTQEIIECLKDTHSQKKFRVRQFFNADIARWKKRLRGGKRL